LNAVEAAKTALRNTRDTAVGETALIFCDSDIRELGQVFSQALVDLGLWTRLVVLENSSKARASLDDHTREQITSSKPDLFVNLFRNSGQETAYRIQFNKLERHKTDRICHCPGLTMSMLTNGAASLTDEEYKSMFSFGEKLKEKLKGVEEIFVESHLGSNFSLKIDKEFSVEYGGNLPCGEVLLMPPIGNSFEGKIVCISGGVNRIYRETPVEIISRDGLAGEVRCEDQNIRERIEEELDRDPGSRYLGEFAFGINPKARLVDEFLEAEKVVGTIHVAFGGSYYPSKTHLDLLIENPTVKVTRRHGEPFTIMSIGKFRI